MKKTAVILLSCLSTSVSFACWPPTYCGFSLCEPCRSEFSMNATMLTDAVNCLMNDVQHSAIKIKKTQADYNLLRLGQEVISAEDISEMAELDSYSSFYNNANCSKNAEIEDFVVGPKDIPIALQNTNLLNDLNALTDQISQGYALSYQLSQNETARQEEYKKFMGQKWKDGQTVGDISSNYTNWSTQTYNSIRNTLNTAGLQMSLFSSEDYRIEQLKKLSDEAEGRNQLLQVFNHIASDQMENMVKLRQLQMTSMTFDANMAAIKQNQKDADRAALEAYRNKKINIIDAATNNPSDTILGQ